jgi:hypothetical protein
MEGKQSTGERRIVQSLLVNCPNSGLFFLFLVRLVALFADLVFLGRFFTTGMRALLALGNRVVAAIIGVLLAFAAELMFFMRLDATFVVACFPFRFRFHATALSGKSAAGTQGKRYRKGDPCKCLKFHFPFSNLFCWQSSTPPVPGSASHTVRGWRAC